ncbi:dUTP diphosphatase [Romboutsia sp. 1001216sp1]|uniref:dUTP diphosphatase n=1 Tax=Romboutsia sp. 1001216sp1 TaxID=2986997 RepID=UPI00232D6D85|nr:dUTP diphosphatase [Romboutsia sp. 1001216sp1]MDB8805039.1 dUTP diphosphatase [Romboutsia sp. 1001216sp1]MDB8808029.1 dUTP diphosphatase [Romboutsia sp. 1001216sp1]MDB8810684.1 dUTP diphosphatase [Romboutsia sp. 1001216sp1]MDB8816404.1 dUTP diphosphatase [Romboutsia sp. 1001216sp1]MDB8818643.1 dUTP diphosphatase [Romboutsia sp. 1001216sp1]
MIIDLSYVKKEQEKFLEHLSNVKGYNYQKDSFCVPYWIILALQSELGEILQASSIHKWWSDEKVNKGHLIEECADFLAHLGNVSNILNVDMIFENLEIQTTAPDTTFNKLAYRITTLSGSKNQARNQLINYLVPLFLELLYSLGFNIEQLECAYEHKMKKNYERF